MMSKPLFTEDKITINATARDVWSTLTKSDHTVKYMYGCEVDTDWKVGSDVLWVGREDKVLYVKGSLITYDPHVELTYTVIDPNGKYDDIPENYLTVSYQLEEQDDQILLTVTQGDYNLVADGSTRYQHSIDSGGWSPILQQIKEIVEGQ